VIDQIYLCLLST